jgi:hypothetical protein
MSPLFFSRCKDILICYIFRLIKAIVIFYGTSSKASWKASSRFVSEATVKVMDYSMSDGYSGAKLAIWAESVFTQLFLSSMPVQEK